MEILERFVVWCGEKEKAILLLQGDLAAIPRNEAVDVLVISAFPGDYSPTSTSVVGALARAGISVEELARDKRYDLRAAFACWLSRDLAATHPAAGFSRILCFEPSTRESPAAVAGDLFRAMLPFAFEQKPIESIALSLLAAGDRGGHPEEMLEAIVAAAVGWLRRGLPVASIKIVLRPGMAVGRLRTLFRGLSSQTVTSGTNATAAKYDCFVSYSHQDMAEVDVFVRHLRQAYPEIRVFQDKLELKTGCAWQAELDDAIASSRKVIPVYSPSYIGSKMCLEEFNMARVRHRRESEAVLAPVYLKTASLPLYMQSIQYADCREADPDRMAAAAAGIVDGIAHSRARQ